MHSYKVLVEAEVKLNSDLVKIANWSQKWMVEFNPSKTVFINFSLKKLKSVPRIVFNDVLIKQVKSQKHLGVILSEDMNWAEHINYICGKAYKKIGLLFRNSIYLDVYKMSMFYQVAIRPVVEYGSIIFDNCSKHSMLCLENVQRRAALVCSGAMKRTETSKMLYDLSWESLKVRRDRAKLILFFKIKNGLAPEYLKRLLPHSIPRQDRYALRQGSTRNLQNFKTRLKCYETSYFPSTIALWNKLSSVNNTDSLSKFKRDLSKCNLSVSNNVCKNVNYLKSNLFFFCSGFYGRLLNKIRYELSPLKSHLFTYCIIDNPMCPNCHDNVETTEHFFLDCIFYKNQRIKLKNKLHEVMTDFGCCYDENQLLLTILHGVKDMGENAVNKHIFEAVRNYISESRRFSSKQ
jgi:hypothetical protein